MEFGRLCLSQITPALTLSHSHDLPSKILPLFVPLLCAQDLSEITEPSLKKNRFVRRSASFILTKPGWHVVPDVAGAFNRSAVAAAGGGAVSPTSHLCNITLEVKLNTGAPGIQRGTFPPQRAEYQMVEKQKRGLGAISWVAPHAVAYLKLRL